MFKTTNTHWQWTEVAESNWKQHDLEPRRTGQKLMERDRNGNWVKRLTVPLSWVEKGYVQEAAAEQTTLF